MKLFVYGHLTTIKSTTINKIKTAFNQLAPDKIFLDGTSDIAVIVARICVEEKIPYSIFLPSSQEITDDTDRKFIIEHSNSLTILDNIDKTTQKATISMLYHLMKITHVVLLVVDEIKNPEAFKALKMLLKLQKSHLLLPA